MITISVVIPAYNCADAIKSTIDSIFASGISDFEIVIVDDGSEDGTAHICDALAREHACIRCIHQRNAGVSAARNRGAKEAAGEYLWFFDADDSVKEGSGIRLENILRGISPDMLVFGVSFDYYHHGRCYRSDEMLPPVEGLRTAADCGTMLYELFLTNSLSAIWNRIIKRSVVLKMQSLFREDMFLYEDLEFSLRALKQCETVYYLRDALYRYRQAENEGNAGRRLMRIPHIPDLLTPIEEALAGAADRDRILLSLYQTLAREKISVSAKPEIETVCSDFRSWIDKNGLLPDIAQNAYSMLLYRGQASRLIAKRNYSKIRHSTANWVKQTIGDFRKW